MEIRNINIRRVGNAYAVTDFEVSTKSEIVLKMVSVIMDRMSIKHEKHSYAFYLHDGLDLHKFSELVEAIEGTNVYTPYCKDDDITFIMLDTMIDGCAGRTECIGWYYGSPNDEWTLNMIGDMVSVSDESITW